jgi:tripartite-type tricarboxylate transporter receptor subunit TctC
MHKRHLLRAFAGLAALAFIGAAPAQDFPPKKAVTLMVGFAPGGAADAAARLIAKKLGENIGQTVLVENKAGAGGNIAHQLTANGPADGSMLLFGSIGPLTIAPHMMKLPYDPFKDLAPVIITTSQPNLLVVSAALPVKNVREFVAYAKANPGKLNYASVGAGSSSHLTMELLKANQNLFMVHIPFNGSPPAAASVAQNETQALFAVPTAVTPLVEAGKMRALAVSGLKRYSVMPQIPTLAEGGVEKFEALAWNGVVFPAATPRPIIERMNREMDAALKSADVREKLRNAGLDPVGGTPEEFARLIRAESDKWAPVIKRTGAKID